MTSILSALLWAWLMASSFLVSAFIVPFASPMATTGLRFLFALIIMTPFYLAQSRPSESTLRSLIRSPVFVLKYLFISGSLVGFFIGLFTALKSTTSLNTSVIYTLVPLIGALIMLGVGIRTPLKHWVGYVLGTAGAITVLIFSRDGHLAWHSGDAIYVVACVLLALHVVSVQVWGSNASPFEGAYRITLFGSLWLWPIMIFWGDLTNVRWYSREFWLLLSYLTLFTTLITFVLQQMVVKQSGASRLLAFSYTIPIWVSLYFASHTASLTEELSLGFVIGALMVLIALVLIDNSLLFRNTSNGSTST
ncbi:EamA/RhaT family transporter [Marinomonas piezotolerans]|uniref:EamA/RhaT family transporter n=1 Tax=Marinomonas piezotolerans TaxID=2213058 RepID=A0A370U4W3_9GAMM|nr:DMT family transporter [Marinomonas piezotolerans]RDL42802.1 EamA/RhaT family transporter [Marinomonas piezotolerans]